MVRPSAVYLIPLLLLDAAQLRAQQACPASTFTGISPGYGTIQGSSPTAIFDTATLCGAPSFSYCGWRVQADYGSGTFLSWATSGGAACGNEMGGAHYSSAARLADDYTLVGPGSDPITISAVLAAQISIPSALYSDPYFGTSCVFGNADVRLARPGVDSTDFVPAFNCPNTSVQTRELRLPIDIAPGNPFDLHVVLAAYGSCATEATAGGTLRFDGLPEGYYIISCKGFLSGVVPTRATSWGQLKQIYR